MAGALSSVWHGDDLLPQRAWGHLIVATEQVHATDDHQKEGAYTSIEQFMRELNDELNANVGHEGSVQSSLARLEQGADRRRRPPGTCPAATVRLEAFLATQEAIRKQTASEA